MLLVGRIETTGFQEIFRLQVIVGLDTAEEHCLLDQRDAFEINCQVTRSCNLWLLWRLI